MNAPLYAVEIVHPVSGKPKVWDRYDSRERAESQAAELRKHGLFAQVRKVVVDDDPPDPPWPAAA